jgi:hypothetical protein
VCQQRATCEGVQAQISQARQQIEVDQQAIRNLGIEKSSEAFVEWESLAEQVQRNKEKEFLNGLLTFSLTSTTQAIKAGKSLNPWSVNKTISLLKTRLLWNPTIDKALRTLARTPGKPGIAQEYTEALENMGKAIDVIKLDKNTDMSAHLDLSSTLLSWGVKDPRLAFGLAGVSFMTSLAYAGQQGFYIQPVVDQLLEMTGQQLKALARIRQLMEVHVKELNRMKDLARTLGCETKGNDANTLEGTWLIDSHSVCNTFEPLPYPQSEYTIVRVDETQFRVVKMVQLGEPFDVAEPKEVLCGNLFIKIGPATYIATCKVNDPRTVPHVPDGSSSSETLEVKGDVLQGVGISNIPAHGPDEREIICKETKTGKRLSRPLSVPAGKKRISPRL